MSFYKKNEIKICSDDTIWGYKISDEGLKYGYIDYKTLAHGVGDMILNNEIISYDIDYWILENGSDIKYYDTELEDYVDYDDIEDWGNIEEEYSDIYQYYIISSYGAELLQDLTDEILYYNENLNMWLWGITHFGTGWSGVLTDIKIIGKW